MASIKPIILFLFINTSQFLNAQPNHNEEDLKLSAEIPDPNAINAYHKFWDAFQAYEQQKTKTAIEEYQRTRDGLESIYAQKEKNNIEQRFSILDSSIKKYNETLEEKPNASNRPFVLLNLAQLYAEKATLQKASGNDSSKSTRQLGLALLKSLNESFTSFEYNTDALYLRANLLEANDEHVEALQIWKKLANTGSDHFTVHGNLVSGDHEFENASPEAAIKFYEQARNILSKNTTGDHSLDELRVNYRLAWANFKASRHIAAIAAIRRLTYPGVLSKGLRQKDKILNDTSELLGFALYELNNDSKAKEILNSKEFVDLGGKASLVLMNQLLKASLPGRAENIGTNAIGRFALSREYPDLLKSLSSAYEQLHKTNSRIETLEKLSMLLPQQSLWRARYQNDLELVQYMESLAKNSAEYVASSYYEDGLSSENAKKFSLAATQYEILLAFQQNSTESPSLRLKIANCNFFAGNLTTASKQYEELISGLKTPEEILLKAHYQRVLTLEKIWRRSFELNVEKRIDPVTNTESLKALNTLNSAIDEYANRYPNQSQSVDLLLVAGSANRDHNKFDTASKFWQRALLTDPNQGQRSTAIRGLIFAKIRNGDPSEVLESVSKFLKLDNSAAMTHELRTELLGVLASAANEQALKLSKKGATLEAGALLAKVSSDFPDIPNREQLWRDGGYFIAISGKWSEAQSAAEKYLANGNTKFAGDMTYLLARSHEYQLRFNEAVKYYLLLAERYPTHARSAAALDRAEKLASAEENHVSAAKALKIRAERSKDHSGKLDNYDSAVNYLILGGQNSEALTVAEIRKNQSRSNKEKLESELQLAKIRYQSGDKQTAVDDLDTIAKQLDRARYELGDSYKRLSSEANMKIAEHILSNFNELKIGVSKSDIAVDVSKKSKMFADIVTRLDVVANLEIPEYCAKARFLIGQAATEFSDEITALPLRNGEPQTLKTQSRFNQNISHLKEIGKRYHSNNILAKQRSPQLYVRNEWISRSALALSTPTSAANASKSGDLSSSDQLSLASGVELPQQWGP